VAERGAARQGMDRPSATAGVAGFEDDAHTMRSLLRRFQRRDGSYPMWLVLVVLGTSPVWLVALVLAMTVALPVVIVCDYTKARPPRWCALLWDDWN
jgi:hypothetical protein